MNIVVKSIENLLDWQGIRIMVDGPIWDFSPVWKQADEIISTGNFITIVAYEQTMPVGYVLYNVINRERIEGVSKEKSEELKSEIRTALETELQKAIEAQKK